MNKDFKTKVSEIPTSKFITGTNFSNLSDIIYSEAIDSDGFSKIDSNNIQTCIKFNKNIFIYTIKNFSLKENQIIFCKTDYLLDLFTKLKNVNLKNIKLITHQAATPSIDKKLFKLKPKCISEWYSINVEYVNESLIPIPLGLGNFFSNTGIQPAHLKSIKDIEILERDKKIYCNFDTSTNILRNEYINFAEKNKKIFEVNLQRIDREIFLNNILKFKFVLSPPGVGMDTHRFWEALYSGCIPIAKRNYIYDKFFMNNYLSFENISELNNINKLDFEFNEEIIDKLHMNYWEKMIRKNIIESSKSTFIETNEIEFAKNRNKLRKSYIRYKIIHSHFKIKIKLFDLCKTVFNFNDKLYQKYWR
jgi:hypothetical protein